MQKPRVLGAFEVTSGRLIISDPCYGPGVGCQVNIDDVLTGTWEASVRSINLHSWGRRVAELEAHHALAEVNDNRWELCPGEVGVDSGQAGIFDQASFPRKADANFDTWFRTACRLTNSDDQAGVLPAGAVSSSGVGDGGYEAYVQRRDGKVVAVKVVYLDEE